MKIFSINSTYVRVTWQPLPAIPSLWKTFNASTTGYNIYVKETSYPWSEYPNKTVFVEGNQTSFAIVGPLGAAREYTFEIAAANHVESSKKTDQICVKMPDGGLSFFVNHFTFGAINLGWFCYNGALVKNL